MPLNEINLDIFPEQLRNHDWIYQILESMADGIWVCDATPRLLWINSVCANLNDIKQSDVCGKTVEELLGQGNFDKDVTHKILKTGQPTAIIQKVRSGRTLLVNGVPVFDSQGKVCLVVGTERDLTELNVLRERLDASEEIQQKFQSALTALSIEKYGSGNLIAFSEAMNRILETCIRVAAYDTTLLLTGETGTGKSMVAGFIHKNSNRKNKPFMSLNCGAIPPGLVEAELFGYTDGAFTGAMKGGKPGLIEAANGGTLFLDEIDAFSLELQVKLLTFLDTQRFIRVGDTKVKQVDVRLIVATNQNLQERVTGGLFRADLLYRLNVLPMQLPPLRNRIEDIPSLINLNLNKLSKRYGQNRTASKDLIEILTRYDFPGNVRELENILERAFVMTQSDEISPSDLPIDFQDRLLPSMQGEKNMSFKGSLHDLEYKFLIDACSKYKTQSEIARFLDVSQPTVARLLKRHNLSLKDQTFIHL